MPKFLSELFAEQEATVVDWYGPLYGLYELPGNISELTIRFVDAIAQPPQGVRLRIRGGSFVLLGERFENLVFWNDTAAPEQSLTIEWKRGAARSIRVADPRRDAGLARQRGNACNDRAAWSGRARMQRRRRGA